MSFFLPNGLRDFFGFSDQRMYARAADRGILGDGQMILFDGFYACLMLGVLKGGLGKKEDLETQRFIEGYPKEFSPSRDFIAALVVDAELRRVGTDEYDNSDFERGISKLLQVDSPTGLSAVGLEAANLYAAGGYSLLEERLKPRPGDATSFFFRFNDLCEEEMQER